MAKRNALCGKDSRGFLFACDLPRGHSGIWHSSGGDGWKDDSRIVHPQPAKIIRRTKVGAFVTLDIPGHEHDGGDECERVRCSGFRMVAQNEYAPSPNGQRLRAIRVDIGRSLRDVSKAWDLSVVQVSALELGSMTLTDDEWKRVFDDLRRMKKEGRVGP